MAKKKPEYIYTVEGAEPSLREPPSSAKDKQIKRLEAKVRRLKAKHKPSKRKPSVKQKIARRKVKPRKERIEKISRVYSQRPVFRMGIDYSDPTQRELAPAAAYRPYTTRQGDTGESTALYSMEYNKDRRILTITFWGYKQRYVGSTYAYYNVPYDIWVRLNEAGSKGRFFYYNIRTVFSYGRIL